VGFGSLPTASRRRHTGRADAESHSMPHSSGGASMPRSANFSVRRRNVSAGKRLAARQLETLCGERQAILAVLVVPPSESMTSLAVWRMTISPICQTVCNMSNKLLSKKSVLPNVMEPVGSDIMATEPIGTLEAAERLRNSREALKLTPTRICALSGIERNTWSNAENGLNRLSVDNAIRLCQVTGLTLDWLYRGVKTGLPLMIAEALQRVEAEPPQPRRHK
jgi:DNA-binding XRE family transcriptional regulator